MLAALNGVRLRRVTPAALARFAPAPDEESWLYEVEWRDRAREPDAAGGPGGTGTWLIVADRGVAASALARSLEAAGAAAVTIDADRPGGAREALDDHDAVRGVVHLVSLDAADDAIDARGLGGALDLVQVLASGVDADRPRLWLVTRGAQPAGGGVDAPAQAPLWGLGRVVAQEHPALHCTRIDLDPAEPPEDVAALAGELLAGDAETEVAFRAGRRLVTPARSQRAAYRGRRPADRHRPTAVTLEIARAGRAREPGAAPRRGAARPPGRWRSRSAPRASTSATCSTRSACTPATPGRWAGSARAGRRPSARRVGGVAAGDEVMAIAPARVRHLRGRPTRGSSVHRSPAALSFAQAATMPITFLTAWYGLHRLGGISRRASAC